MNWKVAGAVTLSLFGAGVAVGYAAQKRGIPQNQIGRWVLKGVTRRVLLLADSVQEVLPAESPKRLGEALNDAPPRPEQA